MHELPPGQRAVQGFPRFGVDLRTPPPAVPSDSPIEIIGDLARPTSVSSTELARLPRVTVDADFHCVAGWSAVGQAWEGWSFRELYATIIEPALTEGATVGYFVFIGADQYRSIVTFEDATAADVLVADRLNGQPLSAEHGAPLRLVSPHQYGFISTKHLCQIELHATEPPAFFHPQPSIQRALRTVRPHSRARVWKEERHRYVPSWLVRPIYHRLVPLPAPPLTPDDDAGTATAGTG